MNQQMIKADLMVAEDLIYSKEAKHNPYMYNIAAYHCSQVVEKSLKLFISEKTGDEAKHTHNISELLVDAERLDQGFIHQHSDIAQNYWRYTMYNQLRYDDGTISKAQVTHAYKNAKRLYYSVFKDKLKNNEYNKE